MGCGSSADTAVQPLPREGLTGDEDETGSKLGNRGDSAVSKGTTDSGVVMENPALPGAVPRQLPPLTSESVRESEVDRITRDGLVQQDSTEQERPKSCEILEELLNQGIIPMGRTKEKGSGTEAYSIVLDDREGVRRRPPARLESLKARKAESLHSKEEIDEKMRLADERRKLKEDELKTRLRTKSARVRGPAPVSGTVQDEDASLTPVEPLQPPLSSDLTPAPALHSQVAREAGEGGERVREDGGEGRECGDEMTTADRREGREEGEKSGDGERDEEELTEVQEFKISSLLTAVGELESDFSFQQAEGQEETF